MAVQQLSNGNVEGATLGQSASDKVGFHGATPVVQNAAVANATDAASVILRLNELLVACRNKGLIAS